MKAMEVKRYKCGKCNREYDTEKDAEDCCTRITCSCGRAGYTCRPHLCSQQCCICEQEEQQRKEAQEFRAFNRAWH